MNTASINDLRQRILHNEPVSRDEMEAALAITREARSAGARKPKKTPAIPADLNLAELFAPAKKETKDEN